jgi:hypothetical protein
LGSLTSIAAAAATNMKRNAEHLAWISSPAMSDGLK